MVTETAYSSQFTAMIPAARPVVPQRPGVASAVPSSRRRRITVSSSRQKIRAKPMRTTTISRAPAGASTAM